MDTTREDFRASKVSPFLRYFIGLHIETAPKIWAPIALTMRSSILLLATWLAVSSVWGAWIGLLLGVGTLGAMLPPVTRILFLEATVPNWEARSARRFVLLAFGNVVEALLAFSAIVSVIETLNAGASFDPRIDSVADALGAVALFGPNTSVASSAWGKVGTFSGSLLVLFMVAVAITAAISAIFASSATTEDLEGDLPD